MSLSERVVVEQRADVPSFAQFADSRGLMEGPWRIEYLRSLQSQNRVATRNMLEKLSRVASMLSDGSKIPFKTS